jgi:SAM-dependent methyltransferase
MAQGSPGPDWGVGHDERTAQLLLPAAQVLVDAVGPLAGQRVLDVGAGTGNAALLAAEAGADVTAVDPSPRLLSVAADAARQRGLHLRCEVGQASALPVDDGAFDCVLSSFAVIFAPDADAAVAEVARVLRANGRVALTAWLPGGALGALASTAQELVRAATGAPQPAPGFPWDDGAAVTQLLGRHGLSTTAVSEHELVLTDTSPEAYLDAELRSHPLAVAGFELLRRAGTADAARERLLQVLVEHNQDATGFRSSSRYVVHVARRA